MSSTDEEETEECRELEEEINLLKQEIQNSRDKIFRYYILKRKTESLANISDNESLLPNLLGTNSSIELSFYNQIVQLKSKDDSLITVLFPFYGESRFGVNFVKTNLGMWSLEKSHLPHSVDLDHFTKEISQLNFQQIPEYLEEIQRNVFFFCIRENFVEQLKKIIDPRIRLYHCLRYTEIELTFKVFNTELKIRRSITVRLNFDLFSTRPRELTCKINGEKEDDGEEMKNFFKEHFKIFHKTDFITAYKQAFADVDKYNFFV